MHDAFDNLLSAFYTLSERFPQKVALHIDNTQVTYHSLYERVLHWSKELEHLNIGNHQRVLVIGHQHINTIAIIFAVWQRHCTVIPLENSLTTEETHKALIAGKAHWMITDEPSKMPTPSIILPIPSHYSPDWCYIQIRGLVNNNSSSDESALFFYTSGTTGAPKCVMFDHTALYANIFSFINATKLSEEDHILTPLSPLLPATLTTAVWPTLCSGATLTCLSSALPGKILQSITQTRVTVFYAVPYLYDLLLTSMSVRKTNAWTSVRLCLSSSAFLDVSVFKTFYAYTQLPIHSLYCSSEAGVCTYNNADDLTHLQESVGHPLPSVTLEIINEDGECLPPEQEGLIRVSGPHIAKGYFCQPALQEQVFQEGKVLTGDIGSLDKTGYLKLTGRLSETINISGHLVNPKEVEHVLVTHPAVAEALVYGEKKAGLGEIIVAKIVLQKGLTLSDKELVQVCTNKIAHYKIPQRYDYVEELPKSRYGKTKRFSSI